MRVLKRIKILHIPQIIPIYLQSTNFSIQIAQISKTVEIVQMKGSDNIFSLLDILSKFQIIVLAIDFYQYQFFIKGAHQKVAILTVFFLGETQLFYTKDSRFYFRYLKASLIHRYHQQNNNIRGIIFIKDIKLIINFLFYEKYQKYIHFFYFRNTFSCSNEYYNYTMINKKSCSSFSSFQNDWENQPHFQEPKNDKKHKNKVATRQNKYQSHKTDTLYFSEFEEDTFENKFEVLAKEDRIIKKLKDQIEMLKKQNHKLTTTNRQLIDDLQRTKQINVRLEEKIMMKGYEELRAVGKKQKIESLLQQIDRVKDNMSKLRAQSEKDKLHIASLKSQLFCYQKMEVDWTWKDKFIQLFVDMLDKITTGIDLKWTNKKKIQVGWKVVKNLVHKALVAGIKPPRVQRNRQ